MSERPNFSKRTKRRPPVQAPTRHRPPQGREREPSARPREESEGDDAVAEGAEGAAEAPTVLRRRRSLTHVGGKVETSGDREAAAILAQSIEVTPSADEAADDRAHVHGFHVYPARAHPVTARRLIEGLVPPGGVVLDPFCGSGTVLVEAMLAGRAAIGTDLNPIAVMLARAKTFPRNPERSKALVVAAQGVAEYAEGRRRAKAGATRRLPREDVAVFAPHILLELDGLRAGIAEAPPATRPELSLVLSSILVKMSGRRGDTSEDSVEKRIAAGYPTKLFVKKTEELARRFDEFFGLLDTSALPRARVYEDDATQLKKIEDASVDAIITSPPYVGTYDYLTHHELRMRWLGLDARKLARGELGARRNYEKLSPRAAMEGWERELGDLFRAFARVLKPGAPLVLLIADSAIGRGHEGRGTPEPIRADEVVSRVAERGGELVPVARASQARPHFHGPTQNAFAGKPRLEHALLLRRR